MIQATEYTISEVKDAHQSLLAANRHRDAGETEQAQHIYELLLEQNPDYSAALYSLGMMHMARQDWAAAYPHLLRASMLNPGDWSVLVSLGHVYLNLDANESGYECFAQADKLNPDNPEILYSLGAARQSQFDHATAATLYKKALSEDPDHAGAAIQLAICYAELDRYDEAAQMLADALKLPLDRDQRAHAYYTLSELPVPPPEGINLMEAIEELGPSFTIEWEATPHHIAYARGALFHKSAQYEDAWRSWRDINLQIAGDTQAQRKTYFDQAKLLRQKAHTWEQQKPAKAKPKKSRTPVSLFILGASRAGKSTLESLLSQIDGIEVGYENEIATSTAVMVSQRADLLTVDLLANLPTDLNSSISDIYHAKLKAAAGDAEALTITHHGAIYDVGRLVECVPDARFIFLKRDEDDNALRIFTKLYQPNSNPFAYHVPGIYEYISQYHQMIDNWLEKLGKQAMLVQYEEMVEDPQSTLKRLTQFCGLKLPSGAGHNISDDRGYSDPYKAWLHAARDGAKDGAKP